MSEQPKALLLSSILEVKGPAPQWLAHDAAAELRRQHALIAELVEALQGMDDAYCRAGTGLTRAERSEDRRRLIAARFALSKAKEQS